MRYPYLRTKVNARSIGTEGEMNELEPNAGASQSLWFAAALLAMMVIGYIAMFFPA
jgi:hypothetical protein